MPRYAPLSRIQLDPRSESELVAAAAQRVFEASGATINDFSAGSPIMALLEGQAFAQAEFLQFANEFPEAVLLDWIGPFLGAQRKTGSGSIVGLTFEIDPRDQDFVIFEGFEAATNPSSTFGESINFVTTQNLIIPAGQSEGTVEAVSVFVGINTNVAANSITRTITSLAGIKRIFNREPAVGGSDVELLSEVKERFFSLIRRRNPVSREDWVDFFTDAMGVGAVVNVLPNRSEREFYQYNQKNPFVSFFLLNPNGTTLTEVQIKALENLIKWSLPVQFQGKIYSVELSDLDVLLEVAYNPDNNFSIDLQSVSKTIRNNLAAILSPNAVFPPDYQLTANEVSSKLDLTFPQVFGTVFDPTILNFTGYFTPNKLSSSNIFANVVPYRTGKVAEINDLVRVDSVVQPSLYPVIREFSPQLGDEFYHANLGDLSLQVIKPLTPGQYKTGEVVSNNGILHVVLSSFLYTGTRTATDLINQGFLSIERSFSPFQVGSNYQATTDSGKYDPQILEFRANSNRIYEPQLPENIPLTSRVGYPVWVVAKNFTRLENLTDLGSTQALGYVSRDEVAIKPLQVLTTFRKGEYVQTPNPNQQLSTLPDPESCYLDQNLGAIVLTYIVNSDFTFRLEEGQTIKEVVDSLVSQGILSEVQIIPFIDCDGKGYYASEPFKYNTRFSIGEYVRFRSEGGFDSSELEDCLRQASVCPSLQGSCRKLLESELPLPSYFLVAKDFTPNTSDIQELIRSGFLVPVDRSIFFPTYTVLCPETKELVTEDCITSFLFDQQIINSLDQLIAGQVAEVVNSLGNPLNYYTWDGKKWISNTNPFPKYRELFRFAPGDVASFKQRNSIFNYEATSYVTPITEIDVYYKAGIFVPTSKTETVKFFDPQYRLETISSENNRFYRTISPFTPEEDVSIEEVELSGKAQKIVCKAEGSEKLFPRLDLQASMLTLGSMQVKLRSKGSTETFQSFTWGKSNNSVVSPETYGNGTLGL